MTDANDNKMSETGKNWLIAIGSILGVGVVGAAVGVGVWYVEDQKKKEKKKHCHKKKKQNKKKHHGHTGGGGGGGESPGHGGLGPGHAPPHGRTDSVYNGKPYLDGQDEPAAMGTYTPFSQTSPYSIGGPNENYDSDRLGDYDPYEDDEMDVRRLMPVGGGWRGDKDNCGDDDLDTTAFGRWAPKARQFRDFISTGGSARFGINTRTKSPIGGIASLRDMLVGSAPTPLTREPILFGDSSHRQDLVFEATGKYPELRNC